MIITMRFLFLLILSLHFSYVTGEDTKNIQQPVLINVRYMQASLFEKPQIDELYHQHKKLRILPKRSAVLFMDVADADNEITQKKIIPLLSLARKKGMQVIHAIHEYEILKEMEPLPGEIIIKNYVDDCLSFLKSHGIDNLFVIGSGTNTCILDRPCGLLSIKERQLQSKTYLNMIFLRKSSIAAERPGTYKNSGNKRMTINMIEDYVGYTSTVEDIFNGFNEPFQSDAIDFSKYGYEDQEIRPALKRLPQDETLLLVANGFGVVKNKELSKRINKNRKEFLEPLIALADHENIPVIYGFDYGIPKDFKIEKEKDRLITTYDDLVQLLNERENIRSLLFAGYTTNRELLYGSMGLFHFRFDQKLKRHYKKLIVEDATVGFEYPDSLEEELAKGNAIHFFEINGLPQLNGGEENRNHAVSLKDLYEIFDISPDLARVKKEDGSEQTTESYCDQTYIMMDIFNPYSFPLNINNYGVFKNCKEGDLFFRIEESSTLWRSKELRRLILIRQKDLLRKKQDIDQLRVTAPRARPNERGFKMDGHERKERL